MRDLKKEELKVGDFVEITSPVTNKDWYGRYKLGNKGFVLAISTNNFGEKTYRVDLLPDNETYFLPDTTHYYLRRELRKCGSTETEDNE